MKKLVYLHLFAVAMVMCSSMPVDAQKKKFELYVAYAPSLLHINTKIFDYNLWTADKVKSYTISTFINRSISKRVGMEFKIGYRVDDFYSNREFTSNPRDVDVVTTEFKFEYLMICPGFYFRLWQNDKMALDITSNIDYNKSIRKSRTYTYYSGGKATDYGFSSRDEISNNFVAGPEAGINFKYKFKNNLRLGFRPVWAFLPYFKPHASDSQINYYYSFNINLGYSL